jgi:3alpha(or 20beta)-hydroxysteroid dehydrogenase
MNTIKNAQVAIVTGASRGIGAAVAQRLAKDGFAVAVNYASSSSEADALVAELTAAGTKSIAVKADVSNADDVRRMFETTEQQLGKVDVLVNNAGVLTFARIDDMPLAEFRRVLEVNAVGCWLGMKAVTGPMKAAGGGSIINISSVEGFTGGAGLSAYSASKFAIRGMTKSAAQELGEFGIRVNSVHPGGVLTSMTLGRAAAADPADGEAFLKAMPLARFARPAEISCLVAYLASDESSYSTGSEFVADGGLLSGPGY